MEETPHERLCRIFEEAVQLDGQEQIDYLEQSCGEDTDLRSMVGKMLKADLAGSKAGLEVPAYVGLAGEFGEESLPKEIGPFRIVRRIGAGGMGIVYEAEQKKPNRSVALKVMRGGTNPKQRERFEFESEVLGSLQHKNIAHIYGAGTAETEAGPKPWISMELVDGSPIDDYARANNLGMEARLALVVEVLGGVAHAHSKGVVHRDLKPGNVLVDTGGEPHIVDFGVARIVEGWDGQTRTQIGDIVGTIAYMSPEQVSGDPKQVSTQSDIYSVATMAFELITGELPLDLAGKSIPQAIDTIREGKQKSLRTQYGLSHDLDSVFRKALDPDPERRYPTADAFAEDLRRFLRGDAILARPPSALYQLKCLGRRNKVATMAIGAALLAILGGGATSTYLYFKEQAASRKVVDSLAEASDARDRALEQEELSGRGLKFYGGLFSQAGAALEGRQMTVGQLVDKGISEVPEVFPDSPLHQAHLLLTFAIASHNIGNAGKALSNAEEVVRLIEETPLDDAMLANSAYLQYSLSLELAQRYEEAIEACNKAVAVVAGLEGENEKWGYARAVEQLAFRYSAVGDRQKGLDAIEMVMENLEELKGTPGFQGHLVLSKAKLLYALSRFEEAAEVARESLKWLQADGVESGPQVVAANLTLGSALTRIGKLDEALETLVPLAPAELELNGPGVTYFDILKRIASCHAKSSRHEEAIDFYTQTIEAAKSFKRGPDLLSATCRLEMGKSLEALGRDEDARVAFGAAVQDLEGSITASQFSRRASAKWGLARVFQRQGKFEEALQSIDAALADIQVRIAKAPGNPNISGFYVLRAKLYVDLEQWDQAGRKYFETLKFGVENGFSKGLWPEWTEALGALMDEHPEVFEDYAEEARALIEAAR